MPFLPNCLNCAQEIDLNDPSSVAVKIGRDLKNCCNKNCWEAYSYRKLFEDREEQILNLREQVAELEGLSRAKHETIEILKEKNENLKRSIEFWYGQLAEAIEFNERSVRN